MARHVHMAYYLNKIRSMCTEPSRDNEESRTINHTQAVELSDVKVETKQPKQRDLPAEHNKLLNNDNTNDLATVNSLKSSPSAMKEKENLQR